MLGMLEAIAGKVEAALENVDEYSTPDSDSDSDSDSDTWSLIIVDGFEDILKDLMVYSECLLDLTSSLEKFEDTNIFNLALIDLSSVT